MLIDGCLRYNARMCGGAVSLLARMYNVYSSSLMQIEGLINRSNRQRQLALLR